MRSAFFVVGLAAALGVTKAADAAVLVKNPKGSSVYNDISTYATIATCEDAAIKLNQDDLQPTITAGR